MITPIDHIISLSFINKEKWFVPIMFYRRKVIYMLGCSINQKWLWECPHKVELECAWNFNLHTAPLVCITFLTGFFLLHLRGFFYQTRQKLLSQYLIDCWYFFKNLGSKIIRFVCTCYIHKTNKRKQINTLNKARFLRTLIKSWGVEAMVFILIQICQNHRYYIIFLGYWAFSDVNLQISHVHSPNTQ